MMKSTGPWRPSSDSAHEPPRSRRLLREPEYEAALWKIFKDLERADDVLGGLELFLMRRAEMGMAVRGLPPDYATWLSKELPEGRVRVLYRFDDTTVDLLDATLVPDPEVDASWGH